MTGSDEDDPRKVPLAAYPYRFKIPTRFGDNGQYADKRAASQVPLKAGSGTYPTTTNNDNMTAPKYDSLSALAYPQQDRTTIGVPTR